MDEAKGVPTAVREDGRSIAARSSVATVSSWRIFEYESFLLPGGVDGSLDDPGVGFEGLRTGSGPSYGPSDAPATVERLGRFLTVSGSQQVNRKSRRV